MKVKSMIDSLRNAIKSALNEPWPPLFIVLWPLMLLVAVIVGVDPEEIGGKKSDNTHN